MSDHDEARAKLSQARALQGKAVGRDCDEYGCARTVDDGPLYRVNPKGEPGIFMCKDHTIAVNAYSARLDWEGEP